MEGGCGINQARRRPASGRLGLSVRANCTGRSGRSGRLVLSCSSAWHLVACGILCWRVEAWRVEACPAALVLGSACGILCWSIDACPPAPVLGLACRILHWSVGTSCACARLVASCTKLLGVVCRRLFEAPIEMASFQKVARVGLV